MGRSISRLETASAGTLAAEAQVKLTPTTGYPRQFDASSFRQASKN